VTSDRELRRRIVQAAAELFSEHGYEGTRIRMVAQRAGVTPRTVRRLTGGRSQLFAIVIAETVTSQAADQIARIRDPAHRRRHTEADSVAAVALACEADRLAQASG
jgi:AcrR family transcriptional regulator